MIISMEAASTASELTKRHWDHGIHGEAIDPRGTAAVAHVISNSKRSRFLQYKSQLLGFSFDGVTYSAETPETAFNDLKGGSVVIETTTLSFLEILLCLRGINGIGIKAVTLLYAEPESYFQPRRSQIVHRRDFELSDEVEIFKAVPGNTLLITPDRPCKAAVFLGYEGQRLGRLLEQVSIPTSACTMIFGVPAYHPGWEMHAFVNNFKALSGEQLAGKVTFCGAHNPLSAYMQIARIHSSLATGERILIVPIGTKPHGIGAALFLSQHPDVGVVYDNPKRKKDRSDNLGSWHTFDALF